MHEVEPRNSGGIDAHRPNERQSADVGRLGQQLHSSARLPKLVRASQIHAPRGFCQQGRSSFYKLVQRGMLPKPIHPFGTRIALWDAEEVAKRVMEAERSGRK